jgi:Family of unknown function (DUF6527)
VGKTCALRVPKREELMSKFRKISENPVYKSPGSLAFKCPGCGDWHSIDPTRWKVSGTDDKPTVEPSLLVTCGHYVSFHKPDDTCWCTYNKEHPDQPGPECYRCHSFIREGNIQFLGDCTHKLKGQTVPLPDLTDPDL